MTDLVKQLRDLHQVDGACVEAANRIEQLERALAEETQHAIDCQRTTEEMSAMLAAEKARADTLPEMALAVVAYELSCAGYDEAYTYASGKYVKRMLEDQCRRKAQGTKL